MVWPIIRGKSYVGETGKSMKAVETTRRVKKLSGHIRDEHLFGS
jgi:hypothetical protein